MSKKVILSFACLIIISATTFAAGAHQFGLGVNYWELQDRQSGYDKDGFSYYGSYRYNPKLWGYMINLEHYPEDTLFRSSNEVWEPQAYALIGKWIYGAAGIGWRFGESKLPETPTYYLKAGLNFSIFPLLKVDINAQYKYQKLKEFDRDRDVSADAVTVGVALSMAL
jgi:hypothetical protein